jgi:hypothetical protein
MRHKDKSRLDLTKEICYDSHMVFHQARHPNRLNAPHPRIIEDLLEMVQSNQQESVNSIILMLPDFYTNGRDSRYLEKFKSYPFHELKTRSRGGQKGGARVYLFLTSNDEAVIVNAEIKTGKQPDPQKLEEVAIVLRAYRQGIQVIPIQDTKKPGKDKS